MTEKKSIYAYSKKSQFVLKVLDGITHNVILKAVKQSIKYHPKRLFRLGQLYRGSYSNRNLRPSEDEERNSL